METFSFLSSPHYEHLSGKLEKFSGYINLDFRSPKDYIRVGEGGIILLPGASLDESFTDEDEEIMKYLQGPPSPCDVAFINDNVLIDGKSSISQKTKKSRPLTCCTGRLVDKGSSHTVINM
ncbi:hypothetical protein WA026_023375 [Henosepilachna vigintioctopunctata]|uniref:Uncharacterized protein n=1 Tax=Henosepilachna vigintioctopunctata TaxID=420089 RepID=A0AAW1V442_9CUCU